MKRSLLSVTSVSLAIFIPGLLALVPQGAAHGSKGLNGLPPASSAEIEAKFTSEVWPILKDKCSRCHGSANSSSLQFASTPNATYQLMLAGGFFNSKSSGGLMMHISPHAVDQMPPPPLSQLSSAQVATIGDFCNSILMPEPVHVSGIASKTFPAALLLPYHGPIPKQSNDNTFLTYYQLRNKIKTVFDDGWHRNGIDEFQANIAQFGGADFVHSFNERSTPSAEYLSALDPLSQDVAERAYLDHTGPFAGMNDNLPAPVSVNPSAAYKHDISLLFDRMLFRPPTADELLQSYKLIQAIYASHQSMSALNYKLDFRLYAKAADGLNSQKECDVTVSTQGEGQSQFLVNENNCTALSTDHKVAMKFISQPISLVANDPNQKLTIYNDGSIGKVQVTGVLLQGPGNTGPATVLDVKNPAVQLKGNWRTEWQNGVQCLTDDNQAKGASSIEFPLNVKTSGKYLVGLLWPDHPGYTVKRGSETTWRGPFARNLLVCVRSHNKSFSITPPVRYIPPEGSANYKIDESDDTRLSVNFKPLFKFGENDGIEISNTGTFQNVVADTVRFLPWRPKSNAFPDVQFAGKAVQIPAKDAVGAAGWKPWTLPDGTAYTPVTPGVLSDLKGSKGKLSLLFKPSADSNDWRPQKYYRVEFAYPGSAQNDESVPVTIHAQESSPIIRIACPARARAGAEVTIDASASFNVQHTPLQFTWQQISGPMVHLQDPHAQTIHFVAPVLTGSQAAWVTLCAALVKDPDFLFTRPLSLATEKNPVVRKQLQLVKIAQDLVARPPTREEIHALDTGAPLSSFVDKYLSSSQFAKFYFRRVRLYLESHGSPVDDEPVRLWTWIMLHHKSFKQILTADYTITPDWQVESRPAYCGHSGVLTMQGFIDGKPGLPHFNYAAQVLEKFLGYVFVVPEAIIRMREGITATSTTTPGTVCFQCHQIITPLEFQRARFNDEGLYQPKDAQGQLINDSDMDLVPSYPFRGEGMQAFAEGAANTERYIRTIIQTHFVFYFGREMRCNTDERTLYHHLWNTEKSNHYDIRGLIKAIVLSKQYLNGDTQPSIPERKASRLALVREKRGRSHVG